MNNINHSKIFIEKQSASLERKLRDRTNGRTAARAYLYEALTSIGYFDDILKHDEIHIEL